MKRQGMKRLRGVRRAGSTLTVKRRAARSRRRADSRSQRTRSQLIEAGGKVFAAKGFDGATGQEICLRARANAAAIVYHFGSMAGLYRAVLTEGLGRLVTTEALAQAVKAEKDPRRQLEAFLGLIVQALTSPVSRSWPGILFGREFVSPSAARGKAHDRALAARSKLLKSIVSALTGKAVNDVRVARSCVSIMAPCAFLLLIDRRKLRQFVPELDLRAASARQLSRHLVDFSLAGLAAIARRRS
jgi:TetR/AcrR family transcriptional regulator, regulator of cefoperazone and chloramphenicol sensitivity